jgi:hypothetical protein
MGLALPPGIHGSVSVDSNEGLAKIYVQQEVFQYISEQHDACDTLEGVVTWWIFKQRLKIGRDTIQRALDALVADGKLRTQTIPGGRTLYVSADHLHPTQQQE